MKRKYMLHYGDYDVGENENLYTEMAAKGWRLVRRGRRLSRFEPDESVRRLRCRIRLISPDLLPEGELPADQAARCAQSGWRYVTHCGLVHVFCGPAKKKLPPLYDRPEQQAATRRTLRREAVSGFVVGLLGVLAAAFCFSAMPGMNKWLMYPEWLLLVVYILACLIGSAAYGATRTMVLYRQLARGGTVDHSAKGHPEARRVGLFALTAVGVMLCLLLLTTLLGSAEYDMPATPDGPYLTLAQLGWEGVRTDDAGQAARVTHVDNLAAEIWDTYECLRLPGEDGEVWMYMTVYRLKAGFLAGQMPGYLAGSAVFDTELSQYVPVEVPGLDAAWMGSRGLEYIAVRGSMAWQIIYADPGVFGPAEQPRQDVLAALAGAVAAQ